MTSQHSFHAGYASFSFLVAPPLPHPPATRQPRAKTLGTINQPLATAGRDGVTLSSVCRRIERPCPRVTLTLPIWHPWYLLAAQKIEQKKNTQEFKVSRVKVWTFSDHFVFYLLCAFFFGPPPTHSFLSMSNHCPLQPPLFGGSRRENVVLMLSGDQSSVKQEAENDNVLFQNKNKREVWAKIGFRCRLSPNDGQPATRGVNKAKKNTHGRLLKLVKVGEKKKKVGKVFKWSYVEDQLIYDTHVTRTLEVIQG